MLARTEIARLIDSYVSFVGGMLNCKDNPIPSTEEAQLNWWYQFGLIMLPLQEVKLPQLIDAISEFPIVPVIVGAKDTNRMQRLKDIREESKALSLLLKLLILGEKMPDDMPHDVWFKYGIAQMSKARFNLAAETYIRSRVLQTLFQPGAAVLWACCECSDARWKLENSGVIGNPTIPGKTDYLSHQTQGIKKYSSYQMKETAEKHNLDWTQYLPNLLYQEAQKIVKNDDRYFDNHHYSPFWRIWRRFNNAVIRRDDMQSVHVLPDGQPFVTGSHNKIPKDFQPKRSSAWQPTKTERRR